MTWIVKYLLNGTPYKKRYNMFQMTLKNCVFTNSDHSKTFFTNLKDRHSGKSMMPTKKLPKFFNFWKVTVRSQCINILLSFLSSLLLYLCFQLSLLVSTFSILVIILKSSPYPTDGRVGVMNHCLPGPFLSVRVLSMPHPHNHIYTYHLIPHQGMSIP